MIIVLRIKESDKADAGGLFKQYMKTFVDLKKQRHKDTGISPEKFERQEKSKIEQELQNEKRKNSASVWIGVGSIGVGSGPPLALKSRLPVVFVVFFGTLKWIVFADSSR